MSLSSSRRFATLPIGYSGNWVPSVRGQARIRSRGKANQVGHLAAAMLVKLANVADARQEAGRKLVSGDGRRDPRSLPKLAPRLQPHRKSAGQPNAAAILWETDN